VREFAILLTNNTTTTLFRRNSDSNINDQIQYDDIVGLIFRLKNRILH